MGGQVVQDDVHIEGLGDVTIDLVEERDEVDGGVTGADVGDLDRPEVSGQWVS